MFCSFTCQASVTLWPPGTSLRWTALTEVEVTLIIIQGVVLRTNTRGLCFLCVVLLEDMAGVGPLRGGRWLRLYWIYASHYLGGLGRAGDHWAVHCDLRTWLLGVLVLWLLCSFSLSAGHHSECNPHYSHKGRKTGDSPHGWTGSENKWLQTWYFSSVY